ncbi:probable disease resistance protein At1g61180 [Neltuma alba]|uniref:probable disease resistance protein At1g61180 n=1 Tax=Neltuma alba TaxID=207710 RepID=UPI0010A2AEFB|nr:probable disease resistance protein At1g61180 [Prosopis alba]
MAQQVVEICGNGNFNTVSYRVPPPVIPELITRESNEGIESRVPVVNQIMEALRNPNVNMIGLCGLPGVGKTTTVKEVAKNKNMFEKVIMTTVSKELNVEKIQGQIAEKLGLQLNEKTEDVRAARLCVRLKQEKNMLLILDDLWEELDLGKVGIPFVEGCKMLLTSRNEMLLSKDMKYQEIIKVGVLLEYEAWELFKRIAELSVDSSSPELASIAIAIVRKCGGLPLMIATAAKALKNKDLNEWKDALARLNNPLRRNNTLTKEVDTILKLSYNRLSSSEYKHIFLFAAMLSHDPSIEDLLMCSVGLDFLKHVENMEEAHVGIAAIVSKLKSLNLFLDSFSSHYFTMHDVIRDVALSIASSMELFAFIVKHRRLNEWPDENMLKGYKGICLQESDISDLPDELHGPQLEFFLPIELAELTSLQMLNLSHCSKLKVIPQNLLSSLKNLEVLQMGNSFDLWKVEGSAEANENASLDELKDLPISSLDIHIPNVSMLPENLFLDMNLKRYRIFIGVTPKVVDIGIIHFKPCGIGKLLPLHVLKSLNNLEELEVRDCDLLEMVFDFEDLNDDNEMVPSSIWDNLEIFEKQGSSLSEIHEEESTLDSKYPLLSYDKVDNLEELRLWGKEAEMIGSGQFPMHRFPRVKLLYLNPMAPTIISYKSLWESFPKLDELELWGRIRRDAFGGDDVAAFAAPFRKLTIGLVDTPCLESVQLLQDTGKRQQFWDTNLNKTIYQQQFVASGVLVLDESDQFPVDHSPKVDILRIERFVDKMITLLERFPQLKALHVQHSSFEEIFPSHAHIVDHKGKIPLPKELLTVLKVSKCHQLVYLVTNSMAKSSVNLETLEMNDCKKIEEIVTKQKGEDDEDKEILFCKLKFLKLDQVPALKRFCSYNYTFRFPLLDQQLASRQGVLDENDANIIWNDQFPVDRYPQVEILRIERFFDEWIAFPKMEKIVINETNEDVEGRITFNALRILKPTLRPRLKTEEDKTDFNSEDRATNTRCRSISDHFSAVIRLVFWDGLSLWAYAHHIGTFVESWPTEKGYLRRVLTGKKNRVKCRRVEPPGTSTLKGVLCYESHIGKSHKCCGVHKFKGLSLPIG